MSRLEDEVNELEGWLKRPVEEIGNYADRPYIIFCYQPSDEWGIRRAINRLKTRLQNNTGKEIVIISLAELFWKAIEQVVTIKDLADIEAKTDFVAAHDTVASILTSRRDRRGNLAQLLAEEMSGLLPDRHIVFLTRVAAFAPTIYPMSTLLDQLALVQPEHRVPTVLFYPGYREDQTLLRYMHPIVPESIHAALGNYFDRILPWTVQPVT